MQQEPSTFLSRLRTAGIEPDDSSELRQQKSLLVFVSGLVSLGAGLWLMIYWAMGPKLSASLPFLLQLVVALNLAIYVQWRKFELFQVTLLAVLLFFPFAAQWALGDFVSASGLILWGLLSPICALLCLGVRESSPWFFAYIVLTLLTGAIDFALADLTPIASPVARRTSMLFFALNFATISAMVYLALRFALRERAQARAELEEAHARLAIEQARSERLLLNILPAPIALRLKNSEATVADGFAEVTVMFADIVGFTQLAADKNPGEVFTMLNEVFSRFDELAEARGLEKIKTIGDAYMVAGGLNDKLPDPAAAVAELALDMCTWLASNPLSDGQPLEVRIGIGSGPVVAGVVGKKKFIYDLWGDTVNLASRITGECAPGNIQCDARTYSRLAYRFVFEDPVTIRLKGKGMVSVWRLLERAQDSGKTVLPSVARPIDYDLSYVARA